MNRTFSPLPRTTAGFSLLEVLLAVVILSVALLGMAALQLNMLKKNESALQRSQATILGYSLLDMQRAGFAPPNPLCEDLKTGTGKICGSLSCSASTCTATVTWDDSRAGGGSAETLTFKSRI